MFSPPSRVSFDHDPTTSSALPLRVQLENVREQLSVQRAIADGAENFLAVISPASAPDATTDANANADELKLEVEQELRGARDLIEALEREIVRLELAIDGHAAGLASTQPSDGTSSAEFPQLDSVRNLLRDLSRLEHDIDERIKLMDGIVETLNETDPSRTSIPLDHEQHDRHRSTLFHEHLDTIMDGVQDKVGKDVRAASYRLLRHVVHDPSHVHTLILDRHLHFNLIRSLARDAKHDLEKEQALRLIRRIVQLSTSTAAVAMVPLEVDDRDDAGGRRGATAAERHGRLHARLVAILRGVVAIAEQPEEKLRLASLETLGELVIRDVSLLVKCEGLRVVLQAMSDGIGGTASTSSSSRGGGGMYNTEMSTILAMSFLGIVDHPDLRKWLRPGIDLEVVLSGFTEVQGKGSGIEDRIKASSLIVETLLKSWSGLLYLNVNGRQALTSLVDSLTNPSRIVRDTLLDMLSNVFNVDRRPPPSPQTSSSLQPPIPRQSGSGSLEGAPSTATGSSASAGGESRTRTNLIDQFSAILLLTFIDSGLVEGLAQLATDPKDASTASRVSNLIGEILDLSNRVLPSRHAAALQSLPRLFELSTRALTTATASATVQALTTTTTTTTATLTTKKNTTTMNKVGSSSLDEGARNSDQGLKAREALLTIAALNRDKRIVAASRSGGDRDEEFLANFEDVAMADTALQRNLQQRQLVESDKLRAALSIDDVSFRNSLLETGVLSTKEDTKWSIDLVFDVLQGPLRNPKRLDEAMRASKFMKRLLAFFHPLNLRYSDIRKDDATVKYTRLGRVMIKTLLSDPQGAQYLAEDKLLPQIADCLLQIEPTGTTHNGLDVLFSRDRVETTLVSGYFEILGEMTKSSTGSALLDQHKLFTCFYRIGELRNREDLVKLILEHCDFSRDGHPRVFLRKALTSSYKHIRLFATEHLGKLIRQAGSGAIGCSVIDERSRGQPPPRASTNQALEWQIDLLVPQLYDPAPDVNRLAVSILTRACVAHDETLEMVVRKEPQLEHLGDTATELLTQFFASPVGVRYLDEIDFIETELQDWFEERNHRYMVEVELSLAATLQVDGGVLPPSSFDGTPPPHFYGELVKTIEGCEILAESEHFLKFCDVIRDHADGRELEPVFIARLKSVLWAVGHIGSTENGLALIEEEFILPDIVEIACTSPVYSLRGTAVFALALMSSTLEGVEMLEELGWESIVRPLSGPSGLCIPMELNDLVFTPTWPAPEVPLPESLDFGAPASHVERDCLVALANLSNHILATKASKQLAKLKSRPAAHHLFSSTTTAPTLLYRAFDMLANHHYRQPVRKFILDLFEYDLDADNVERLFRAGRDLVVANSSHGRDGSNIGSHRNGHDRGLEANIGGGVGGGQIAATTTIGSGLVRSEKPSISLMIGNGRRGVVGGDAEVDGIRRDDGARRTRRGGGIEGELTEDEDQSSVDNDDLENMMSKVPLKVLSPLVTVRGFLLSPPC